MQSTEPPPSSLGYFSAVPQPLHKRYAWLCCLVLYIFCICVAAAAGLAHLFHAQVDLSRIPAGYWVGLLPLVLLLTFYTIVSCRAKGYLLREHDVSFYSGVIFKVITIQPFSRLQHIEVTRGPLERLFGLATLKLFSAGGAQHTLAIPGLLLPQAEYLRSRILDSKGLAYEQ